MSNYLLLAEMELIIFLVAGTVLCLGFRVRIMLITHLCFSCCWEGLAQSQRFFSFSCGPESEEAGGDEKMGGDTAGTADPEWPEGYPRPYGIVLNTKTGGVGWGWQPLSWGLAGHWSVGGEKLHCHLFCLFFYHYSYLPFLFSPCKLSSSQPMSSAFFPTLSPIPLQGKEGEAVGSELLLGLTKTQARKALQN